MLDQVKVNPSPPYKPQKHLANLCQGKFKIESSSYGKITISQNPTKPVHLDKCKQPGTT